MKFETFKAGRWHPRYQYKSFEPVSVNHEWIWEDATVNLLQPEGKPRRILLQARLLKDVEAAEHVEVSDLPQAIVLALGLRVASSRLGG